MSFAVEARDVLRDNRIGEQRALDLGEEIVTRFTTVLSDDAVRREVYEEIRWDLDEISMVEVHAVLDGLIRIIKGEDLRSADE
jgi:8-oxo-dGTP pyrophosphatase MutT (NUDIX family)